MSNQIHPPLDGDINRIEKTYRTLKAEGREIIRLFNGNPNDEGFIFPPEILQGAYARYFRNQVYHPHSRGLPKARAAISHYYETQGCSVDPEHIVLTAGTSESFFYLFSLLAKPGDNILAPNPAYPLFDFIAHLAGIELRHYALREESRWSIDVENLRNQADDKTRAVVLISPNNPTGVVPHADEIAAVVQWANAKNIPVICDEVFSEFFFGAGRIPRAMAAKPKLCFTLNGISKMFALPALKLGWIAVTGETTRVTGAVEHLETTADTFLSCHIPIQEALPEIFDKGRPFVDAYVAEVGRRRRLAMDLLKGSTHLRVTEPMGGFYLTAEVLRPFCDEEDFVVALMQEKNVFVHPGYFFDYDQGLHVVISFLVHPDRLTRGITELIRFVER